MRIDIVDIGMEIFRISGIVDHGDLHGDIVLLPFHGDDILYQGLPVPVQESDEFLQAFF